MRLVGSSGRPSTSATTSRVRSSSVGPSPPVRMTRSARASACANTRREVGAIVADDAFARSSMPSPRGGPARKSELVSSRVEPSSSRPTAMISAVRSGARIRRVSESRRQQPHQQAQRQVRVDPRHRVVGHDAEAAVQPLEPVGGIRLDDVEARGRGRSPASAPDQPTGMKASVISMPTTSSITTGPGSMPPKYRSAVVAAQTPAAEASRRSARTSTTGEPRPPDEQVDERGPAADPTVPGAIGKYPQ